MTFCQLQTRLTNHLRHRIQGGESTERSLARLAGISQPHLHNVLKGKRSLSMEMADEILQNLQMSILDLIQPQDVESAARPSDFKKLR